MCFSCSQIKKVDLTTKSCQTLPAMFGARESPSGNNSNVLNEPGGVCLHPTERSLYIADTNNHRILSLDLDTNELSTVREDNRISCFCVFTQPRHSQRTCVTHCQLLEAIEFCPRSKWSGPSPSLSWSFGEVGWALPYSLGRPCPLRSILQADKDYPVLGRFPPPNQGWFCKVGLGACPDSRLVLPTLLREFYGRCYPSTNLQSK